MGFRKGAFATVWEITERGDNYTRVRLSISRKDKNTDEYVTEFNGFVGLILDAHKKADNLSRMLNSGRCRIQLGSCDVTNYYDKEAAREYVSYTLYDFEFADDSDKSTSETTTQRKPDNKKQSTTVKKSKAAPPPLADDDDEEDEDEEDCPF